MSDHKPPKIEDAPGLVWRPRKDGWVAAWQARTDLIKAGYSPQSARLWAGDELTKIEGEHIASQCRRMQSDMLLFAKDKSYVVANNPTLTIRDLVQKYQTDRVSGYHKKRYAVRKNHDIALRRLVLEHGDHAIAEIKHRTLLVWHQDWSDNDRKISIAHSFMGHLRTLFGFGATILEDDQCERLCVVMHKMKFKMAEPRNERLTAQQVIAHRVKAHKRHWDTMALAQALQFELMLRQKDCIGEWVPVSEPGISAVVGPKGKWLMGLRWEEIDENLILRHKTSKRGKDIECNLTLAPMVMEELALHVQTPIAKLTRDSLPATGPLIICEVTGYPYTTAEFRRKWRIVADEAGIPKTVRNMDSRAGAITEATEAGIPVEHIKHAATHSDISMTQRYSRGAIEKTASTMVGRVAHRNKPKT